MCWNTPSSPHQHPLQWSILSCTTYQLTCRSSWHISPCHLPYSVETAMLHSMQQYILMDNFFAVLQKQTFFSYDRPADLSGDFVAVGRFINSQRRRFSELEGSSFANLRLELASSKTSGLTTIFIIVWRRSTRALSRNGTFGLFVWNFCRKPLSWAVISWKKCNLMGIYSSKRCSISVW